MNYKAKVDNEAGEKSFITTMQAEHEVAGIRGQAQRYVVGVETQAKQDVELIHGQAQHLVMGLQLDAQAHALGLHTDATAAVNHAIITTQAEAER